MTANLLSRLQGLTAPDREVDALIWAHLAGVKYVGHYQAYSSFGNNPLTQVEFRVPPKRKPIVTSDRGPYQHATPVTASLDATVALCERVLPGWIWRVATCHVSDDAWVIPDFNHPIHGERLMREFGQVEGDPSSYWQEITDVDLRPSGRPAIALLIAILTALETRDAE